MPTYNFVRVMDPQPPEGTVEVINGGDGFIYAMPADENEGALDWWPNPGLTAFKREDGVWCLGTCEEEDR